MTFYERIENQGTQTLAVWMFIELLARMCNVLQLGSEVFNWLPASYLEKKEYSLHSAFCTQPAFYSQSAVCILHSLCILPLVRSLQSAVRSLPFALTVTRTLAINCFLFAFRVQVTGFLLYLHKTKILLLKQCMRTKHLSTFQQRKIAEVKIAEQSSKALKKPRIWLCIVNVGRQRFCILNIIYKWPRY